nr:AIG2 family protein [uncultured Gammaproteobacteria bacterium]
MNINNLFVYGTLAPGRPNEHILKKIEGTWQKGSVTGILHQEGWGAAMGYPAITLDENGNEVEGFLFSSDDLSSYWEELDEFEGSAYERVIVNVILENKSTIEAYIYTLKV